MNTEGDNGQYHLNTVSCLPLTPTAMGLSFSILSYCWHQCFFYFVDLQDVKNGQIKNAAVINVYNSKK